MDVESRSLDLRPDPSLLNPSFEGYKLSLEPIPTYRKSISTGVHVVRPDDDQFSFSHIKLFSLHNHLHVNTQKQNDIYFVDENFNVNKVQFSPGNHQILLEEVFQFKNVTVEKKGNYNISLLFPSSDTVLISNGSGAVYLLDIKDEQGKEVWVASQPECLINENLGCLLSDGRMELHDGTWSLHVIASHIEEKDEKKNEDVKSGFFQTVLTWRKFTKLNTGLWEEKSLKKLSVNGSIDHVALEPGCKSLHIVCDKIPQWIFDSENDIQNDCTKEKEVLPKPEKIYTWMQNENELTLQLLLPDDVTKNDLKIVIEDLKLEINVKDNQIISGNFYQRIDKTLSVWCFEKNKLEVQLVKNEAGLMWPTFLVNDDKGNEVVDPDLAAAIHEKLSHLCSDKEENALPPFNSQQLEDCDAVTCESTALLRLDGENHKISHKVNLSSYPWLFKVCCDPQQPPALCFRHDVDACVWQFKEVHTQSDNTWLHQHLGTFSAFGYVQASKTQKKFLSCPPNLSYAVICEASHHIYIYRQPSKLASELKNRQTGQKVKTISMQQLFNLETNEQILGVFATDNILYLLLERSLCVLILNS